MVRFWIFCAATSLHVQTSMIRYGVQVPSGTMPGGYTVAYAPMQMQGQQGAQVPGQAMQQPMVMYMPIASSGQQQMHMVSMPMSAPPGQPPTS
jgi:hypothetical protein